MASLRPPDPATWPWPLPAVALWALCWALYGALQALRWPAPLTLGLVLLLGTALAWRVGGAWRRLLAAAGFPLSAWLALGSSTVGGSAGPALQSWPAWIWALAAVPLGLLYPMRAWRDAPLFPTPPRALAGLAALVHPAPQRVLDAGCGLGHGLRELRAVWPQAQLAGIEWSRPLAWWTARRRRDATVRQGDMWASPWAGHDLVYMFQRPESMGRAWRKACEELPPGAWLVSLEFAVPGVEPSASLHSPGARPVWLYRVPSMPAAGGR